MRRAIVVSLILTLSLAVFVIAVLIAGLSRRERQPPIGTIQLPTVGTVVAAISTQGIQLPTAEPTRTPVAGVVESSPTPVPNDYVAEVQKQIDLQVKEGTLVFNPPSQMTQFKSETVVILIARGTVAPTTLMAGVEGHGIPTVEPIRTTYKMEASLSADPQDFRITPTFSAPQVIPSNAVGQWKWSVTGLRKGDLTLYASVKAYIRMPDNQDQIIEIPVKDATVHVLVNRGTLIESIAHDTGAWIAGSLVAIAGLGWTIYAAFNKSRIEGPPPAPKKPNARKRR